MEYIIELAVRTQVLPSMKTRHRNECTDAGCHRVRPRDLMQALHHQPNSQALTSKSRMI
jgi:hypothetical protein